MSVVANEDFLENQDCVDCLTTVTPSAPCSTTTWSLDAVPTCSGTVKVVTPSNIKYCCTPVGIPLVESTICADCPCYPLPTVVKTLPTKGTLMLLGIPVTANQELTEQTEGLLVYIATTAGTEDTDFFVLTKKWSCGQADVTVNVDLQDADCNPAVPCTDCLH